MTPHHLNVVVVAKPNGVASKSNIKNRPQNVEKHKAIRAISKNIILLRLLWFQIRERERERAYVNKISL